MNKKKLTSEQRQHIKDSQGKRPAIELAKAFEVSHTTIYAIWNEDKDQPKNQNKENDQSELYLSIVKKMIPPFVRHRINVTTFNDDERKILDQLVPEVMST